MCLDIENNHLLSGSRDTTLRLYDLRNAKTIKIFEGHTDWIKSCRLDGDFVISGSCDSTAKVWSILDNDNSKVQSLEGHTSAIKCVYSMESKANKVIVSGSQDTTLKVWDFNYGSLISTLEGHSDEVVHISPFQTKLATCSFDNSIRIWDVEKGTLVCTLLGHTYRVSSMISFENKLLTGSWDKTVKLWEFPIDFRP